MTLLDALEGKEYFVKNVFSDDEETDKFLFSLGCFEGEPVTVISHIRGGLVLAIKDGRYTIDKALASAIEIG